MAFVSVSLLPSNIPLARHWNPRRRPRVTRCKRQRTVAAAASSSSDPPSPPLSPAQITTTSKHQLLRILPALINLPKQTEKVASLINTIESNADPPLTSAFTLLAISGRWRLLFSSALPAREGTGSLRIRSIVQEILPADNGDSNSDVIGGSFVNVVTFTYDDFRVQAKLTVVSNFEFVKASPARMMITLDGHQVKILKIDAASKGPKQLEQEDTQTMVRELQKGVPAEIWDPSGLIDTTFVQPDLRINRFVGKRLAGVRNIFVPEHTPPGRIPGGGGSGTKPQT